MQVRHLLAGVLLFAAVSPAGAKPLPSVTSVEVFVRNQLPANVVAQAESLVVAEYGRGASVADLIWVGSYSVGSIADLPAPSLYEAVAFINRMDVATQATLLAGTSSSIRYDPAQPTNVRSKISDMYNVLLGPARGAAINLAAKSRCRVTATPVVNWKQGTLIIRVNLPPAPRPVYTSLPVQTVQSAPTVTRITLKGVTLYPTFGGAYLGLPGNQEELACFTYGVVADSVRFFGGRTCKLYVFDGFTMQPSEEKIRGAGLQFGGRGPFLRVGAVGASRNPINQQYSQVIVRGGHVGLGYEWKYLTAGLNLGAYHHSTETSGDWFGGVGAFVHLGPNF